MQRWWARDFTYFLWSLDSLVSLIHLLPPHLHSTPWQKFKQVCWFPSKKVEKKSFMHDYYKLWKKADSLLASSSHSCAIEEWQRSMHFLDKTGETNWNWIYASLILYASSNKFFTREEAAAVEERDGAHLKPSEYCQKQQTLQMNHHPEALVCFPLNLSMSFLEQHRSSAPWSEGCKTLEKLTTWCSKGLKLIITRTHRQNAIAT